MSDKNPLILFETEYPQLYEILVNGNPIYAALRDGVNAALNGDDTGTGDSFSGESGRISIKRILDGISKLKRFKTARTLIFTSAVYRRDKGRNLAAEYLMDRYPDAVVFEWSSRNEGFDFAYFKDKLKDRYCPLEWYLIKYKLYMLLHKKEYQSYCDECRKKLSEIFPENTDNLPENHKRAIKYIKAEMPNSYAVTIISQNIFRKLFKKYQSIEYAVDFWGSARENIIPVLPGDPQSVELQHGIITAIHPGYIYPQFVKELNLDFFKRTLLVYGNKTKELLTENSVFLPDKVEVIGNPRIMKYKREFPIHKEKRNLILFTSQPFEQDGKGYHYYDTVIPFLEEITEWTKNHPKYKLMIKLHPREPENVRDIYLKKIPSCTVVGSSSELYDLLLQTYIHITANSTTLYEAALFGAPTITVKYDKYDARELFGERVLQADNPTEMPLMMDRLIHDERSAYLDYLVNVSRDCF